jgi:hypothetical protein
MGWTVLVSTITIAGARSRITLDDKILDSAGVRTFMSKVSRRTTLPTHCAACCTVAPADSAFSQVEREPRIEAKRPVKILEATLRSTKVAVRRTGSADSLVLAAWAGTKRRPRSIYLYMEATTGRKALFLAAQHLSSPQETHRCPPSHIAPFLRVMVL